jgi:NADH:ubiquinone oxidoreductase subunit F (NADH-binding)
MTDQFTDADVRWLAALGQSDQPADHEAPDRSAQPRPGLLDGPVSLHLSSRDVGAHPDRHDLSDHLVRYGPRPDARGPGGRALLAALEHTDLSGRGGGHFPVAAKWQAALRAGGGGLVVANCAEGEPASAKDATLLQLRPHLVLDGLSLAAETVGTRRAVLWLHRGDHASLQAVGRALAERRFESDLRLDIRVAQGPDRYLTGESSAVVRALSGGPSLPYLARQPAAVSGVDGRPTLVHNAETLARVALVARCGPDPELDGPLVTVVGPEHRAVVPAHPGETFRQVLLRSGAAAPGVPQALLVGGYGGNWLPWAEIAELEVAQSALEDLGASLGAGVVAAIGSGSCGLAETARLLAYLAGSSARQCGPCLFGLPALAELFANLASGRCSRADLRRLDRYAGEIAGRGACHHPDGAVRLAVSALRTFAPDVQRHVAGHPCAGVRSASFLPVPAVV